MSKIYEYFGLIFLFYANDHKPIHVHARFGEFESKLELVYKDGKVVDVIIKRVVGKKHLPNNKLDDAIRLVKAKGDDIGIKWGQFFGTDRNPKCEKITKKI
jgi:hypothetical protein